MQIEAITGNPVAIDEAEIGQLALRVGGVLLRAGDCGYDRARVVFNGMFDRRPALILCCSGVGDVVEAVRFAGSYKLLTAVRAGGHSVAGNSSCDGGFVIDLSRMNSVSVDAARRTVQVAGGATWGDVDRETQNFGLATPGGIVSHTGVAGLTLNGGIGWLRNKYGLSCDNLVSAEVVAADGSVVTASPDLNEDLFWALRGGGGNFGVVTSFEFALHPVGPEVATVISFYPLSEARQVLEAWRRFVKDAPDEASTEVITWTAPATPGLPASVQGREVVIAAGVHSGDPQDGMRVLEPLRQFGTPLGEIAGPIPYTALQSAFDLSLPNTGEVMAYWKSLYFSEFTDAAVEIMADRAERRSSPSTMLFVQHLGGAVRRGPAADTPISTREANFVLNVMGDWRDPAETRTHVAWVREAWDRLAPHSTGAVYLNYLGCEDGKTGAFVRSAFGSNYERLARVKRKFDPTNFFRLNLNIEPAAAKESDSPSALES